MAHPNSTAEAIERDPREEDPPLSEPVTQSAGDQNQGRERQELGVHHPLQVERRQAHVSANRREGDRDDGAAGEHEAATQARRGEHLGAALRSDGLRHGERQAAVGQDQGRAAHDLIPQVGSSNSSGASSLASSFNPSRRVRSRITPRNINSTSTRPSLNRRHLQPALHQATVEPRLHMKKAVEADELARFVKAMRLRTHRAAKYRRCCSQRPSPSRGPRAARRGH